MKHTPGPWRRTDQHVYGPLGVAVARCPDGMVSGKNGSYATTSSEARANARLIAAAPDLLEALQCLMATTPVTEKNHVAWAQCSAAIAKATGEQT